MQYRVQSQNAEQHRERDPGRDRRITREQLSPALWVGIQVQRDLRRHVLLRSFLFLCPSPPRRTELQNSTGRLEYFPRSRLSNYPITQSPKRVSSASSSASLRLCGKALELGTGN